MKYYCQKKKIKPEFYLLGWCYVSNHQYIGNTDTEKYDKLYHRDASRKPQIVGSYSIKNMVSSINKLNENTQKMEGEPSD